MHPIFSKTPEIVRETNKTVACFVLLLVQYSGTAMLRLMKRRPTPDFADILNTDLTYSCSWIYSIDIVIGAHVISTYRY